MADEIKEDKDKLGTETQGVIVRKDFEDLGVGEHTRVKKDDTVLTPLNKITTDTLEDIFESRQSYSLLAGPEDVKPLTPEQIEIALNVMEIFQRILASFREEMKTQTDKAIEEAREKGWQDNVEHFEGERKDPKSQTYEYEHIGEAGKVLGKIHISQLGPKGRYMLSFQTVHMRGEENREITGNGLWIDMPELVTPQRLNDPAPYMKDDGWISARRDGKYKVVGELGKIHELAEGDVTGFLKRRRFTDPVLIRSEGWGMHAGWLTDFNVTATT